MSASPNTKRDSSIAIRYLRNRPSSNIDDIENNISEPILFPPRSNGVFRVTPRQPSVGRPLWAQKASTRRGVDMPFTKVEDTISGKSDMAVKTKAETSKLVTPQPRIEQPRSDVYQSFTRKLGVPLTAHGDSTLQVPHFDLRPLSPLQRKLTISPVFSQRVDQNAPIPLPKHSEWRRAGSDKGHNTFQR